MPASDFQGSSSPLANIGRSIFSIRRDQVHSIENGSHDGISMDSDLDSFQKQVTQRFQDLSSASADDILSLSWIRKLLDAFICCQEEFKVILFEHKAEICRPPMDRLVSDYLERSVKALDVCNAIRDGIEQLRQWHKSLEIVLSALDNCSHKKNLGEGQFRRAKKALIDLAIAMLEENDANSTAISQRNRSFGRNNGTRDRRSLGHFRSLSWSVSRSWSAARQLQAIGSNLVAPRANEPVRSLAIPVFTMNMILLFVMWTLVAAIPCQDRGLPHFSLPRQFAWAAPMISLHDRILEESRKRERRNACGLLKEIHQIDKFAHIMNELADTGHFPLTNDREEEVRERMQELSQICEALKIGLDPLERQIREMFHRIVRSRTEGLDCLGRGNNPE
ncbi:hypothetical protein SDJN02_00861, partial [Cucurbita argyrosperma subsp. argyrosperma]